VGPKYFRAAVYTRRSKICGVDPPWVEFQLRMNEPILLTLPLKMRGVQRDEDGRFFVEPVSRELHVMGPNDGLESGEDLQFLARETVETCDDDTVILSEIFCYTSRLHHRDCDLRWTPFEHEAV
jgi:hypothetical protein